MAMKKKVTAKANRKTTTSAATQDKSSEKQTKKQIKQRNPTSTVHQYNLRSRTSLPIPVPRPASPPRNFKVPAVKSDAILRRTFSCRKRRPSVQIGSVQPKIRRRTIPITKDVSDYQRAINALHVSMVPKILPCREKEFKEILGAITTQILDNSGGCMYVCGVPGTGKSSTVAEVIRSLQRQSDANDLPRFELIQLNAMELTEPQQAYVHIYRHFFGKTIRWDDAVSLLDQFFIGKKCSKQRKFTLLVVDEFDMLKSPRQRVIYNILNWSMKKSARLIVVAVGNIVDPGGMGGITSRLGASRFTFLPYTQLQLRDIVQARLTGIDIYENEAVELVARKVATISGDCRRALDIFRRATEIGEKDCIGKASIITSFHVVKAFDEMIVNPKVIAIKGCSKYEKLFLQAVGAEISRTGADETVLYQVYRQFETICLSSGAMIPEPGIALRISSRLGSSRLLICDHSTNSIHQKIMLNVTFDELRYAFD
ncbi:origin recognition complex subunit 1-like [Bradysia coprophila]|uniref:origin recognition complex subunit 1-like n=1 Tax=Bradysia coprophila TaxID=38358 RepID=UPI00187DBBF0|nr:origin recognition complex subunit 1-like [Bradysia coprophila]